VVGHCPVAEGIRLAIRRNPTSHRWLLTSCLLSVPMRTVSPPVCAVMRAWRGLALYGQQMIRSARFAGWTAVAGALVGIAITPFMAAVWAYEPGIVWDDLSLLSKITGPTLESPYGCDSSLVSTETPLWA
jgi:hypothetical protein